MLDSGTIFSCIFRLAFIVCGILIHVHHHSAFSLDGYAHDIIDPVQLISASATSSLHNGTDIDSHLSMPSVHLLLYYMNFQENTKHSIQHYETGIETTCNVLLKMADDGFRVSAAGDQHFITSRSNCESIETPAHLNQSLSTLKFDREAAIPESLGCARKGGKGLMQKTMLKIWLNKINILCIAASKHPDDLTMILDAAPPPHILNASLNQALPEIYKRLNNFHGLSIPEYPSWIPRRTVFGRPECNRAYMPKFVKAHFMAIRGRDCPAVESMFSWGLQDFLKGKCNCYDEEMIISHTMTKRPDMFHTYYTGY